MWENLCVLELWEIAGKDGFREDMRFWEMERISVLATMGLILVSGFSKLFEKVFLCLIKSSKLDLMCFWRNFPVSKSLEIVNISNFSSLLIKYATVSKSSQKQVEVFGTLLCSEKQPFSVAHWARASPLPRHPFKEPPAPTFRLLS